MSRQRNANSGRNSEITFDYGRETRKPEGISRAKSSADKKVRAAPGYLGVLDIGPISAHYFEGIRSLNPQELGGEG